MRKLVLMRTRASAGTRVQAHEGRHTRESGIVSGWSDEFSFKTCVLNVTHAELLYLHPRADGVELLALEDLDQHPGGAGVA